MERFSTREAAKKLGIEHSTLSKYIGRGKVPVPEGVKQGTRTAHTWTEEEIEHVRKLLPKIANGRKTRWQRQKAQAKKAVPGKSKKKK
jgi:predicted site-specific integrase-resolvase